MGDFNHILTKNIIALRRFSEKMDNPQINEIINPFLEKTDVVSIEEGVISSEERLTNIFILNFVDDVKIVLATGNYWQGREDDYTVIYVLRKDALIRLEQSGNYERYSVEKWGDLYSYLQKTVSKLNIINNPNEAKSKQVIDITTPNLNMGDAASKIF